MRRFMGMMPSKEIEKTVNFDCGNGIIRVDSGKNGWTITYPDYGNTYEDCEDTTENNYQKALSVLKRNYPNAVEIEQEDYEEMCER